MSVAGPVLRLQLFSMERSVQFPQWLPRPSRLLGPGHRSRAMPLKESEEMKNTAYQIATPEHRCCSCEGAIEPGGEFYSTVCFLGEEFSRRNYCVPCWTPGDFPQQDADAGEPARDRGKAGSRGIFAYWRTRRPKEADVEVARIRFDPQVVLEFFRGLGKAGSQDDGASREHGLETGAAGISAGPSESQRRDLRFVLSLLLIRKKVLLLKGTFIRDDFEWLQLQERGESEKTYEVTNPELSEGELEQVRDAIGELLQMQV